MLHEGLRTTIDDQAFGVIHTFITTHEKKSTKMNLFREFRSIPIKFPLSCKSRLGCSS